MEITAQLKAALNTTALNRARSIPSLWRGLAAGTALLLALDSLTPLDNGLLRLRYPPHLETAHA